MPIIIIYTLLLGKSDYAVQVIKNIVQNCTNTVSYY